MHTHSLLTRFAKGRTPKIEKWFLREEMIADTPACFIRECWNLVSNRVKWDSGRIMVFCYKGTQLDKRRTLGNLTTFPQCIQFGSESIPLFSTDQTLLGSMAFIKWQVTLPSVGELGLKILDETLATTWMAFVKVPYFIAVYKCNTNSCNEMKYQHNLFIWNYKVCQGRITTMAPTYKLLHPTRE